VKFVRLVGCKSMIDLHKEVNKFRNGCPDAEMVQCGVQYGSVWLCGLWTCNTGGDCSCAGTLQCGMNCLYHFYDCWTLSVVG